MNKCIRILLSLRERERLRGLIKKRGLTLKEFAELCGFSYDALICWLKLKKKKRQPTVTAVNKMERELGTRILIEGYAIGSAKVKKIPKVKVDWEFALIAGLYSADGDKKSGKRLCITSTTKAIIKTFQNYLLKLNPSASKIKAYTYYPREKPKKAFLENARYYKNAKSSKDCYMLALYDSFTRLAFEKALVELEEKMNSDLAAPFLQGVLCGDGCICFDKERKYYEITIALEESEARKTRKVLKLLEIGFKERTKGKIQLINIHKKSNFKKVLGAGGFSLQPEKNEKLKKAIDNYTYDRR